MYSTHPSSFPRKINGWDQGVVTSLAIRQLVSILRISWIKINSLVDWDWPIHSENLTAWVRTHPSIELECSKIDWRPWVCIDRPYKVHTSCTKSIHDIHNIHTPPFSSLMSVGYVLRNLLPSHCFVTCSSNH
jgi:hypothetical protein